MPLTLVIGTWLSSTQTSVYVLDPPSDGNPPEARGSQVIVDEQEFRNGVDRAQLSNLFLYVGATGPAAELATDEVKSRLRKIVRRYEPPERIKISEVSEDYLGVIHRVHMLGDGGEVTIFQGMPESLYQVLEKQDKNELMVRSKEHYEKVRKQLNRPGINPPSDSYLERDRTFTVDESKTELKVQVFAYDGTILRIEIRK